MSFMKHEFAHGHFLTEWSITHAQSCKIGLASEFTFKDELRNYLTKMDSPFWQEVAQNCGLYIYDLFFVVLVNSVIKG